MQTYMPDVMGFKRLFFFLGIFFVGTACNSGGERIIGNGGQQTEEQSEEERLAALEAVCSQYERPTDPLVAVVSNKDSGGSANGDILNDLFTEDGSDIIINFPLVDDFGDVVEFYFDQIFQPSTSGGLRNPDGDLIYEDDNVYNDVGTGGVVITNFATMYTGNLINTADETKYYYLAARSDDGSVLDINRGAGWERIIDNDVGTAPELMCASPDSLITLAPGETIEFRYFHRNGTGGFAVSLHWMDWGSEIPAGGAEVIPECGNDMALGTAEALGFLTIPAENYASGGGAVPEEWTDECYELGYGVF